MRIILTLSSTNDFCCKWLAAACIPIIGMNLGASGLGNSLVISKRLSAQGWQLNWSPPHTLHWRAQRRQVIYILDEDTWIWSTPGLIISSQMIIFMLMIILYAFCPMLCEICCQPSSTCSPSSPAGIESLCSRLWPASDSEFRRAVILMMITMKMS